MFGSSCIAFRNGANTIGALIKLLAIDNSTGNNSICQACNLDLIQAQCPNIYFMHENIRFHTPNWGRAVVSTLWLQPDQWRNW